MVDINTRIEGDIFEIQVAGEIDASSSIHLDNALHEGFKEKNKVLIDLQELNYISSAGLGVFISRLEEIKEKGYSMAIIINNENVRQVFGILGLEELLTIFNKKQLAVDFLNEA